VRGTGGTARRRSHDVDDHDHPRNPSAQWVDIPLNPPISVQAGQVLAIENFNYNSYCEDNNGTYPGGTLYEYSVGWQDTYVYSLPFKDWIL
jgi:hypothetical protein